jgi:acyl-CoA oxidase
LHTAEEHRELVRQQLLLLLKAGYSPLRFYVHDIKKYFYLGELLALVDLSLVCSALPDLAKG